MNGSVGRRQQPAQDVEAAVAADADQPVELRARAGPRPSRPSGPSCCRRAWERRRDRRDWCCRGRCRPGAPAPRRAAPGSSGSAATGRSQQAERAVADADRRPAVAVMGAQRHGADGGVEAGAVAAAGQDADSLGHAAPPQASASDMASARLRRNSPDLRPPRRLRLRPSAPATSKPCTRSMATPKPSLLGRASPAQSLDEHAHA